MQRENDDFMIHTLCGASDDDEEPGKRLDAKNIAICHLTLKALFFKHGIKLGASSETPESANTGADGIMPYMKCILTNIFMKRIIGSTCVEGAGGTRAFDAASGFVGTTGTAERNSTCEKADMAPGGDRSKRPEDWTLLDIMGRWFDRNRTRLHDGKEGILGKDCNVQLSPTRNSQKQEVMTALKEKVKNEMKVVAEEITTGIQELKTEMDNSAIGQGIGKILTQKEKEEHHKETRQREEQSRPPAERPAKPAPAPPVAATPASPPSSGTGGTTSTGRWKPRNTQEDNCEWKNVMEKGHPGLLVKANYSLEELQKLNKVLDEFQQHMETHRDNIDSIGANCENYGWDDFTDAHGHTIGQKVADIMRCRGISTVLWFANKEDTDKQGQDEMVNRFRCELANVLGYMLKNKYCKNEGNWKRGVEYAWQTVQNMGKSEFGTGALTGPVVDNRCTQCGYEGSHTQLGVLNGHIVQWLMQAGLMGEIGKIEGDMPCEKDWKEYKTGKDRNDGSGKVDETKITEVTTMEKTVLEDTEKVIQDVKGKIDEELNKTTAKTNDKKAERKSNEKKDEKKVENTGEKKADKQDKGDKSPPAAAPGAAGDRHRKQENLKIAHLYKRKKKISQHPVLVCRVLILLDKIFMLNNAYVLGKLTYFSNFVTYSNVESMERDNINEYFLHPYDIHFYIFHFNILYFNIFYDITFYHSKGSQIYKFYDEHFTKIF
ncbi:hypothetical protein AK88_05450 [Plasmodium fragile]|uniref:Schizont-infected cell agglutination extracellular alpha domain-containing protein n=1 Tax=Plasmodium fragile TaxID=5857 RepID=A0A0D9QDK0_PLAFR|nr:uncharacterized protein AK88_05450 [Plasmodium fragile]KJP84917.1 hypothetical protein AK88_05450 [Plasmodium fragile]